MDSYAIKIAVISAVGVLLSIYAWQVGNKAKVDEGYEAMCDINEHISCSTVFRSSYSTGFGLVGPMLGEESPLNIPNSLAGIVFYTLIAFLGIFNRKSVVLVQLLLIILSNVMSMYLSYLLMFVLYDLCIVCVSTYVVNLLCLVVAIHRHSSFKEAAHQQSGPSRVKTN